ncbi:hypothetical protein COB64_00670 [Candidatus Wolfebacteria bacterium]|nr:MAG: hypothetical protein COB64_00670 [Candidatus Wolfebacteria bacterium]
MFEKFRITKFQSGLEKEISPEELDQIERSAEQIIKKEFEIGFGQSAFVYEDKENNLAHKVIVRDALNDVHEEAKFLSKLTELSNEVIVPKPAFSFDAKIPQKNKPPLYRKILSMERIDGPDFQEILTGKKELPDTFNFDSFFAALEKFFDAMHSERIGIYHRDVADRNIMIDNKTGRPVIIDFGNSVYRSDYLTDEIREDKQYENGPNDLEKLMELKNSVKHFLTKNKK